MSVTRSSYNSIEGTSSRTDTSTGNVETAAFNVLSSGIRFTETKFNTLTSPGTFTASGSITTAEFNQVVDRSQWLIDGAPFASEITDVRATHKELILTFQSTVDNITYDLRGFADTVGDFERVVYDDGTWKTIDTSDGDGFHSISPPNRLRPPLATGQYVASNYRERARSPVGNHISTTVRFVRDRVRTTRFSNLSQTAGPDDWRFEFVGDTIATPYVQRSDTQGRHDVQFELLLTAEQAAAVMENLQWVDAVNVNEVPDGDDFIRDNNDDKASTVHVNMPSNLDGDYITFDDFDHVVRRWRMQQVDENWYRFRIRARRSVA